MKTVHFFFTALLLAGQTLLAADKPPAATGLVKVHQANVSRTAISPPLPVRPPRGALATLGGIAPASKKSTAVLNGTTIKRKP